MNEFNVIISEINVQLDKFKESGDITTLKKINDYIASTQKNNKEIQCKMIMSYIDTFFQENIIFYHPTSHIYFLYENNNYRVHNEDYITAYLLKYLSKKEALITALKLL